MALAQALSTDDLWWHLAHGQAFLRFGPWLPVDPLLYTAPGPPVPSSWLSDLGLAAGLEAGGFGALRAIHGLGVAAILVGLGCLLRREGASARVVCLGLMAFAILAGDRLIQLRPHLVTMGAALALHGLALRSRAGPPPLRIGGVAGGLTLWANLHPGFLLGPICIATAWLGAWAAPRVARRPAGEEERQRMRRLAALLGVGSLATLLNPGGIAPHLAYLRAGVESPPLHFIREWEPLFAAPFPPHGHGPTSPATWLVFASLAAATLAVAIASARPKLPGAQAPRARPAGADPALLALAVLGIAAGISAQRFLWLAVFAGLLWVQTAARLRIGAAPGALGSAAIAVALAAGFLGFGPLQPERFRVAGEGRFARPYMAEKYAGHAIGLLDDAQLSGRLVSPYHVGGFAGFWLAPRILTHINGSLNVPQRALHAHLAIRGRRGLAGVGPSSAVLDALEPDWFLGEGMPEAELPDTMGVTTALLEHQPEWLPVFRNADSALYLRRGRPLSMENTERIATYFAAEGIPFDSGRGFEPARVIEQRPDWARQHGLIPASFQDLQRQARETTGEERMEALVPLALIHALLGLYDEALAFEAEGQALQPDRAGPRRRRVWSLLRAGRSAQAYREAAGLAGFDDPHGLTRASFELARGVPEMNPREARMRIHALPLLTGQQAATLRGMLEVPPADRLAPSARSRELPKGSPSFEGFEDK